jgi:hypothetical protein
VAIGELGHRGDVGHDDGGIRDRLDIEQAGRPGRERRPDRAVVGRVDQDDLDAPPGEEPGQQRLGRAVQEARRDDPIAGREVRRESAVDGRHPGRERRAGDGAVELGDGVGGRLSGRVADAAVAVAPGRIGKDVGEGLEVGGGEGRRLVDRHRGRALVEGGGP